MGAHGREAQVLKSDSNIDVLLPLPRGGLQAVPVCFLNVFPFGTSCGEQARRGYHMSLPCGGTSRRARVRTTRTSAKSSTRAGAPLGAYEDSPRQPHEVRAAEKSAPIDMDQIPEKYQQTNAGLDSILAMPMQGSAATAIRRVHFGRGLEA